MHQAQTAEIAQLHITAQPILPVVDLVVQVLARRVLLIRCAVGRARYVVRRAAAHYVATAIQLAGQQAVALVVAQVRVAFKLILIMLMHSRTVAQAVAVVAMIIPQVVTVAMATFGSSITRLKKGA
jgi:hypothetical protein